MSVVWMSRSQNMSIISVCFPPDWICVEVSQREGERDEGRSASGVIIGITPVHKMHDEILSVFIY